MTVRVASIVCPRIVLGRALFALAGGILRPLLSRHSVTRAYLGVSLVQGAHGDDYRLQRGARVGHCLH